MRTRLLLSVSASCDIHKPVPKERFARDYYDPTSQRKNTVKYGTAAG
ncbi:hypothetical protein BTUL_0255g00050 [Botrytis tulipae]|uniref:Uncharacterized protein n=1 Tax=Botrytis tulipae TaxID=87230 RepID=A0A4Z1EAW9_9HELO|nr:hypothetical protein BTUL_0255g00050 [Botrytis tulipae]